MLPTRILGKTHTLPSSSHSQANLCEAQLNAPLLEGLGELLQLLQVTRLIRPSRARQMLGHRQMLGRFQMGF